MLVVGLVLFLLGQTIVGQQRMIGQLKADITRVKADVAELLEQSYAPGEVCCIAL